MAPVKKPEHHRRVTYLREWRKYRKLSQETLADRLEIDRTTLSRIERGELPYNQDFLERAAVALGCEPEDIISRDPLRPDPPRLVYDALMTVDNDTRTKVMAMIEALLKAS